MVKQIKYGSEAREKLKRGFDALADAVTSTLGPRGRNVILEINDRAVITKDGVSVAKEIFLKDTIENLGAQMLKEVALNTNKQAGDGTTTATLLAQYILKYGFIEIEKGRSPIDVKNEIVNILPDILDKLNDMSETVEGDWKRIRQIAHVSTNGDDKLAELITELISKTNDSNILFEPSTTNETYSEYVKGLSFEASYVDSYFINSENRECNLDNPYILLYDGKINSSKDIVHILEQVAGTKRSFVIMAEQVSQDVILTMLANKQNKGLQSVIINSPGFGPGRKEALQDIAIMTGGNVIKDGMLSKFTMDDLGDMESITVKPDKTIIKEGKGDPVEIQNRIVDLETIKDQYDEFNQKKIEKRISKFKGGIGVIYIGASSELEYKERYDRLEDSINAVKAALDEGVVPGGGTTLHIISSTLEEGIMNKVLKAPYVKIKVNGGMLELPDDFDMMKEFDDYKEQGILDPKKVTRVALENAVSVASTILTTECVIVDE